MSEPSFAGSIASASRRESDDPGAAAAAAVATPSSSGSPSPALSFRRVEIRRMGGFETGGFAVEELSPGINVIFGPNGCGKSRTAAAMNMLVWPAAASRRASIAGTFDLAGSLWRVDLDAGQMRYQTDGVDADSPPALLPSPDVRDHYNLPLQDLLAGAHDTFAQTILRESAGGFDLRQAVDQLGFRAGPSSTNSLRRDFDAWRAADEALRGAHRQQDEVRSEERRLADLVEAKSQAKQAAGQAELLRKALAYHVAGEAFAAGQQRLAEFPQAVTKLKGGEWEVHQDLTRELNAARAERGRAEQEHRETSSVRTACRLSDTGVPPMLLASLDDIRQALTALRHEIDTRAAEHASAQAERRAARSRIAPALSDEQLSRVVAGGIEPFADLARRAEQARAAAAADDALVDWLSHPAGDDAHRARSADVDTLREGIGHLQRWLSEPADATPETASDGLARSLAFASAGLIVIVAIVLAVTVHLVWALLAVIGIALALPLLVRRQALDGAARLAGVTSRSTYARDFAQLGLPQPAAWTADEVRTLLNTLSQQLSRAQLEAERATRLTDIEPKRAQRARALRELSAARERLTSQLGVAPGTDEGALFLLAGNIIGWQDADRRVASSRAAVEQATARFERELSRAAELLRPFGYPVTDAPALHAAVEDLRKREQRFESATQRRDAAARRLVEWDERIAALSAKVHALFDALELSEGDERTLEEWCEQHPRCCEAMNELKLAQRDLENADQALPGRDDLKSAPRAVIEADLREAEDRAATLEDLQHQIGQIDSRIMTAKQADSVEAALCRKAEAAEALRRRREDDCGAVAGWVLSEYLKRETRDNHRPAVFRGARELFRRITQGRWRLDFDDAEPPAFRATQTATDVGHSLEELSSGTRLQLLLAVRVAFVERQERGARLPMFFDETLANSDEQRARAIIEAAIELARAGRQVFYLTAQPDEVGKWKCILESLGGEVPYRLIDLAEVRGLAEHERLPLRALAQLADLAPAAPDGCSYEEYGRLLKVPGFDVAAGSIGAVHLWHLLDDPTDLHALLRVGLSTWGQLHECRKSPLVAHLGDCMARAEASAKALAALSQAWQVGRGRRVDREAIEESGAVSEVFEQQVHRVLEAVDGDARALLDALEARKVPRFQDQKIEQLRAHLLEHGYLDERPMLSRDEVRLHMLSAVAAELHANVIDAARIDRYLDTWWR